MWTFHDVSSATCYINEVGSCSRNTFQGKKLEIRVKALRRFEKVDLHYYFPFLLFYNFPVFADL